MRVGEVHHVVLSVSDMEASIRFYGRGLGLRKTLDIEVGGPPTERLLRLPPGMTGRSVYFQGPTRIGQLELVQWSQMLGKTGSGPKQFGDPGVSLLAFPTTREGVFAIHERLAGMGVETFSEPETNAVQDYGEVTAFVALDPDGIMCEIINLPSDEEVRAYRAAARGRV